MNEQLAFHLNDCARLMRKRFDIIARHMGVTGPQWRVMMVVQRVPGINQGQLADRLEVEPITTCRMVDRLEQSGLVERRRDPTDRRAWRIYLKDAATPLIEELRKVGQETLTQALSDFSETERAQLDMLVDRLRSRLLSEPDQPQQEARNG